MTALSPWLKHQDIEHLLLSVISISPQFCLISGYQPAKLLWYSISGSSCFLVYHSIINMSQENSILCLTTFCFLPKQGLKCKFMIGTFSHIFKDSITALRKARMLKVAETPTWTQMLHIYDRLLYILYPSLCKSWFPACDRYSINYSTLLSNVFPLLFLNVSSDRIASLLYLQRIRNLSMYCIRLHGYQISVNGT